MTSLKVIQQLCDDVANDKARVISLSRDLRMLKGAQAHLSGTAAWLNAGRIAKVQDELQTLNYLLELYTREYFADCEIKAALDTGTDSALVEAK